jgi:hypothetical protein
MNLISQGGGMNDLLTQWQRLIFPPAGVPVRAGEQLREGNRYPDCSNPDWQAHQDGCRTYAVNPVYPGPDDSDLCKWAFWILTKARTAYPKRGRCWRCVTLPRYRRGRHGLGARVAMCGCSLNRPRFHWFDRCTQAVAGGGSVQGETIPGENQRRETPPGIPSEKRLWAFFFDTLPDTPRRSKVSLRAS